MYRNQSVDDMYHTNMEQAKTHARLGELHSALDCLLVCKEIRDSPRVDKKIQKLKDALETMTDDKSNGTDTNCSSLVIPKKIYERLYPYQREAVKWMYDLYKQQYGGILADQMGMGKTIEAIGFIGSLAKSRSNDVRVLIVCPLSLIGMWIDQLDAWAPTLHTLVYRGSQTERRRNLFKILVSGGVLLSNYQTIQSSLNSIQEVMDVNTEWDAMILDEGHTIKNSSSATYKAIASIPAHSKFILTGTAIQNNLMEFWALFTLTNPRTSLLGSRQHFMSEYDNPIRHGRERNATRNAKQLGIQRSENLKDIINRFVLRRNRDLVDCFKKYDLVAWCHLSSQQLQIYSDFLSLDEVKVILNSTQSPLVALNVLKKICDHPLLISKAAMRLLKYDDSSILQASRDELNQSFVFDDSVIWKSGKMTFLYSLVQRLAGEGHRTLIFSAFRRVLNIIEYVLDKCAISYLRIDGMVSPMSRQDIVNKFQDGQAAVMLLTTKVGGLGLTLTAADRVIVYDPNWNPAVDEQAIDRVCRIGQNRNVVIYRLVTCDTVEEKIYRRQIFKSALFKIIMGKDVKNPTRYFTHEELRALFKPPADHCISPTCQQILSIHPFDGNDNYVQTELSKLVNKVLYGVSIHNQVNEEEESGDDQSKVIARSPVESINNNPKTIGDVIDSNPCSPPLDNWVNNSHRMFTSSTPKQPIKPTSGNLLVESSDESGLDEESDRFVTALLNLSVVCKKPQAAAVDTGDQQLKGYTASSDNNVVAQRDLRSDSFESCEMPMTPLKAKRPIRLVSDNEELDNQDVSNELSLASIESESDANGSPDGRCRYIS